MTPRSSGMADLAGSPTAPQLAHPSRHRREAGARARLPRGRLTGGALPAIDDGDDAMPVVFDLLDPARVLRRRGGGAAELRADLRQRRRHGPAPYPRSRRDGDKHPRRMRQCEGNQIISFRYARPRRALRSPETRKGMMPSREIDPALRISSIMDLIAVRRSEDFR
jgi:hypothetical protein